LTLKTTTNEWKFCTMQEFFVIIIYSLFIYLETVICIVVF
jgi:hypothetical protein